MIMSRVLERLGCEVVVVADGARALNAYLESPDDWDLVLLDLVMPVMSGVRAYEGIRAHSATMPVLFCSGNHDESIGHLLETDALLQFLPKPFDLKFIEEVLAALGVVPLQRAMA